MQGQGVGRLRSLADAAALGHELAPEGGLDLRELVGVARRVLFLAEHCAVALQQVGGMREEGGGDEVLARRRARIVVRRHAGRGEGQPVAEVEVAVPDQVVPGPRPLVVDPTRHALVLALEHALVAVGQVHVPRDDHRRVGPARRPAGDRGPRSRAARSGTTWGTQPLENWSAATSFSHFVKKPATSMLKAAVGEKACGVAGPSQPLVALRAIGGDVEEVALLPPLDVVLELVESGFEVTSSPVGRMSEWTTIAGQRVSGVSSPGIAGHGHVAEAEEGEMRLEGLGAAALERVLRASPSPLRRLAV